MFVCWPPSLDYCKSTVEEDTPQMHCMGLPDRVCRSRHQIRSTWQYPRRDAMQALLCKTYEKHVDGHWLGRPPIRQDKAPFLMRMDMPPRNLQTNRQQAGVNWHLAMPMTNEDVGLTLQSQLVHFVVFKYGCTKKRLRVIPLRCNAELQPGCLPTFFPKCLGNHLSSDRISSTSGFVQVALA